MKRNVFGFIGLAAVLTSIVALVPHTATAQQSPAVAHVPGFEDLAARLLPTVVNVTSTGKMTPEGKEEEMQQMPQMPDVPPGSPFEQFFRDFYNQYQNQNGAQNGGPGGGKAPEEKMSSIGSGFIIDAKNGYIVTNNHVVKGADDIKVTLNDNLTLDAKLIGTDDQVDLAVLQIKTTEPLTAAVWGDSDTARIGSWIVAIGDPFGLGGTVTTGIVSARQRDIGAGRYDQFIQTDAPINRGNSGGPMFNENGEVVGIDTAIFSPSGGSVGIGFAIPSNLAKGVVDQLIKYGQTRRGWLGVHIQEVTPEIAESFGVGKARGALVVSVIPQGPADKAGIKSGDIILKFNGQDIKEMRELPLMVAQAEINKKATITVWRKNTEQTFTVDLGQLEKAEAAGQESNDKTAAAAPKPPKATEIGGFGFSLSVLTDEQRDTYKIPKSIKGVVVSAVKPDGMAADKDIQPGDVISEIDQQEATSPEQVSDKIAEAQKLGHSSVLLFVARGDDMRFVALKFKK
jgi:serine protease Do